MNEEMLAHVDRLMESAGQMGYLHITVPDADKLQLDDADCIAMAKWRDWSMQNSLPSIIVLSDSSTSYASIAVEAKTSGLDETDVQMLVRMVRGAAKFTTFGTQHSGQDSIMGIFGIGEREKIVQAADAIAKVWRIQEHFAADRDVEHLAASRAAGQNSKEEVKMQEKSFVENLVMAVAAVVILDLCLVILAFGLGVAARVFMTVAGL